MIWIIVGFLVLSSGVVLLLRKAIKRKQEQEMRRLQEALRQRRAFRSDAPSRRESLESRPFSMGVTCPGKKSYI